MVKESRDLFFIITAYIILAVLSSIGLAIGIGWIQLLFYIGVLFGAIYLLIKFRNDISQKDFMIGALLAGVSSLYGVAHKSYFDGPFIFFMVLVGFMGPRPVMRKYLGFDNLINKSPYKSIGLGILLGIILGVINLKLAGRDFNPNFTLDALTMALKAGIWEEIGIRFVFYGIGILVLKGSPKNRRESALLYTLMAAPHVLGHGLMDPFSFIILMALFGLPMSVLQRKVDLSSAIIMHTLIDLIRFVAFGG